MKLTSTIWGQETNSRIGTIFTSMLACNPHARKKSTREMQNIDPYLRDELRGLLQLGERHAVVAERGDGATELEFGQALVQVVPVEDGAVGEGHARGLEEVGEALGRVAVNAVVLACDVKNTETHTHECISWNRISAWLLRFGTAQKKQ